MNFRPLAITTLSILAVACSSEDIETANFGSDLYKNEYNLVNATDYEIAFHLANTRLDGDERNAADEKYRVKVLPSNSAPTRITHEHNVNREISFYAESINKLGMIEQKKVKVSNNKDYHFVVMQQANDTLDIQLVRKSKEDHDNQFTVRILATASMKLSINEQEVEVTKGEVTGWYQVNDCNEDIMMGDKVLSLCNASLDRSYLLVVGEAGLISTVLEY
ncbi:hypothetical protein J8Z24_05510 [Pseudoalteromonas sp. SCSIO 43201]|uniref:hypothetical protein n=1 Tax=Pseudoalteromonas sp. SCSIO 43201 TaxID=2822842 RepID=UPI0020765158|nr:hypothetical protein [Pseudoalteromonas sp. SCSIO 43201]USD29542.1 hypothetical protein J8Z24_05510 [Pseudoalteromonas sp. SCSIO 43201]